jgi:plasmid stabilization system protein ParE
LKPIRYHPQVQRDINEAMKYYFENASEFVATQFWDELSSALEAIRSTSVSHHFDPSGLRRLNMNTFPFNILYEDLNDRVRVQAIRHNTRKPEFGTRRKRG